MRVPQVTYGAGEFHFIPRSLRTAIALSWIGYHVQCGQRRSWGRAILRFLLIPVFVTFTLGIAGQADVLLLHDLQEEYDLNPHVEILELEDTVPGLQDILESPFYDEFIPFGEYLTQNYPAPRREQPQKLDGDKVYWYRVRIRNELFPPTGDIDWLLFTGKSEVTKIFVLDSSGALIASMQTGFMIPARMKDPPYGNQYPDRVRIDLPLNQEIAIYILTYGPNQRKPWINVRLSSKDFFSEWSFIQQVRQDGMLIGFILTIVLLNFFLFGVTRDKVFLYQALFQLGILVYLLEFFYLLYDVPLLRDHPALTQTVIYVSLFGMDIAAIQFIRLFLSLPQNSPVWDRVFRYLILMRLVVLIGTMLIFYLSKNMPLSDNLTALYLIIQYIALVVLIWLVRESGRRRYFLILGTLLFTVGIVLNATSVILGIGVRYGFTQLSLMGEVIAFALGLGYRLNLLLKEEREAIVMREMDAFKTNFYVNVTHEFRTPLTVIQGFAEQLKSSVHEQKPRAHLELIKKNSKRLLELVNRLLKLSRLQYGEVEVDLRRANIVEFLRYLFYSFQSYAQGKGVHLRFLAEVENFEMDFDSDKLQDIITNLVSNAIKFTPEGGRISILVKPLEDQGDHPGQLLIRVADSGIGISEEEMPHIFDRFYQSKSTGKAREGSGLGLAISRELVRIMGGEISVASEVGKGTEFSIYLPVSRSARKVGVESPGHIEMDLMDDHQPNEEDLSAMREGKPLALIVDDNYDIVLFLKQLLEKEYNVAFAFDGEEGIDKAISLIPDLIISDIVMPGKDGLELCKTLKADDRTSHIPIILTTAKATVEDRLMGLQQGADAYLSKPFKQDELALYLQNFLRMRERIQGRYGKLSREESLSDDETGQIFETQDAFVIKAIETVKSSIEEEGFGTTQLARELGMSRSQLHRKISALTGMPSSQFINTIRLTRAKHLLQHSEHNVSEIAYQVGLEPNYFARIFKEYTQMSPSAFRAAQQ